MWDLDGEIVGRDEGVEGGSIGVGKVVEMFRFCEGSMVGCIGGL